MPYKRLSLLGWTFSIPKFLNFLTKMEFFNTHRRLHSNPQSHGKMSEIEMLQQLTLGNAANFLTFIDLRYLRA
jgi:hypothetical protein